MNKPVSILVMLVLLMACNHEAKNTNTSQETKNVSINKDSIQKEKVDSEAISKNNKVGSIKDVPFYRELLSKLNDAKDTIYICSRHFLEKFNTLENQNSLVRLGDKHQYEVVITTKSFNKNDRALDLVDTIWKSNGKVDYLKAKNFIDGRKAYGIDGNMPSTEISEFIIKVNQEVVKIPNEYFNDIFNVNLKRTEAYYAPDKSLIFVYINGSDAAGSYSVKYVIDKTGYITRIIADFCGFDFIDGINYDYV